MRLAHSAQTAALRAAGVGLVALVAAAAGGVLAAHHPTRPALVMAAFVLWIIAAMRWPRLWLFVLPATLPMADLGPWTGWVAFNEFDLVVLGAIVAGYARTALSGSIRSSQSRDSSAVASAPIPVDQIVLALAVAIVPAIACARGWAAYATSPNAFDWYGGYVSPMNTIRAVKGVAWALILLPLIRQAIARSPLDAGRLVTRGMLAGTAIVVTSALWERAAFPGLFDFSAQYRTVALFWEMHVGGAAIDGYLAIAMPFVAWSAVSARTGRRWAVAAVLALIAEYACLTTFSRGVYLALFGGMAAFAYALARQRKAERTDPPPWRRGANIALVVAMLMQGFALFGSDSFMLARVKRSTVDLGSRLMHWQGGLDLLHSPADWIFGKGLGRFPVEYSNAVRSHEMPGAASIAIDSNGSHLMLAGPAHAQALAGLYALTQRVPVEPVQYRATFNVRVDAPVQIGLSVCETHLLYDAICQRAVVVVGPADTGWQRVVAVLDGPRLSEVGRLPRSAVFAMTLMTVGARAEIDNVSLDAPGVANMLSNGDFSRQLAQWFATAHDYFVPWHVDNLYLELLIEQGLLGLLSFLVLVGLAMKRLLSPRSQGLPLAPVLVGSLTGALLVGLVSSLLDVPRVGFMLYFLALLAIQSGESVVTRESA